jgi:hypothetical protein
MTETNMLPDFDLSQPSFDISSFHNSSVIIFRHHPLSCIGYCSSRRDGTDIRLQPAVGSVMTVHGTLKRICFLLFLLTIFGLLLQSDFLLSISVLTHLPISYSFCLAKAIYWYSICLPICIPLPMNYFNILYKVTST